MTEQASLPIVFTALMGGYEELNEQPLAHASACRFVCFTDNPRLKSTSWEVQLIEPSFAWDPTRSAREIKICPPEMVLEYPSSLWIDNRIRLREVPEAFLPRLIGDADIALPVHSFRGSVEEEFDAILRHGFDRAERVREQLYYLRSQAPHVLSQRPYWTAIIARKHGDHLNAAMVSWLHRVLRHSRRDQLSVNWALADHPLVRVNPLVIDNFGSVFHEWLNVEKNLDILRDRSFHYSLSDDLRDRARTSRAGQSYANLRTRIAKNIDRKGIS